MATKLNETYWEKRSATLLANLEKDEAVLLKKLEARYDIMLAKIDKEIASYFGKHGQGVTEYASLVQNATSTEKALIMQGWAEFVALYPQYAELTPVDESYYKMTRLQALQSSIMSEQMKIGAKNIDDIEKHLIKTGTHAIKTVNIAQGTGFNQINPNVVKLLVNENWIADGNFKSTVWGNTKKVNDFVVKDFAQGIARGDKYDDMIRNLGKHYTDVSKSDIRRLVYTEGTHVLNESLATGFSGNYEEYIYKAHMDEKTSQICQDLNGQKFKFEDRQAGMNFPPMHPRCRSMFLVVIPNDVTADENASL